MAPSWKQPRIYSLRPVRVHGKVAGHADPPNKPIFSLEQCCWISWKAKACHQFCCGLVESRVRRRCFPQKLEAMAAHDKGGREQARVREELLCTLFMSPLMPSTPSRRSSFASMSSRVEVPRITSKQKLINKNTRASLSARRRSTIGANAHCFRSWCDVSLLKTLSRCPPLVTRTAEVNVGECREVRDQNSWHGCRHGEEK